jgi:hypothetical protein
VLPRWLVVGSGDRSRARDLGAARAFVQHLQPLEGWNGPQPQRHHVYIDAQDFPSEWLGWPLTVEVEAKARGWP